MDAGDRRPPSSRLDSAGRSPLRRRVSELEDEVARLRTDVAASRAENAVLQKQCERLVAVLVELFKRTLEFCGPREGAAAGLQAQFESQALLEAAAGDTAKADGSETWAIRHALESAKARARREIETTRRRIAEIQRRTSSRVAGAPAQQPASPAGPQTPERELAESADAARRRLGARFEAQGGGSAHASPDAPTASFRSEAWADVPEPPRPPPAPAARPAGRFVASEADPRPGLHLSPPASPALSATSTTSFGASSVDGGRHLLWSSRRGSEGSVNGAAATSAAAAAAAADAARSSEPASGRLSASASAEAAAAQAQAAAEAAAAAARWPDGGVLHDGATTDGGSSYADSFRDFSGLSPAHSSASGAGRSPPSGRRGRGAGLWVGVGPAAVPEGDEAGAELARDILDLPSPPYTPDALDAVFGPGPASDPEDDRPPPGPPPRAHPPLRPLPPPFPSSPPGPACGPPSEVAPPLARPPEPRPPERSGFPFEAGPLPALTRSAGPGGPRPAPAARPPAPEGGLPPPRTPLRPDADVSRSFADLRTRPR